MANDGFKVKKSLNVEPQTTPNLSADGDIGFNSTDSSLELYTGGSVKKVVTNSQTQTLTNKTLTAPVISSISNTGTLTLPTSTDTLVGRDTTDTLTNKTLTAPAISTISNTGTLTLPTSTDTLVGRDTTDTLTNKTISGVSNTISNVSLTTGVTGTLPIANGGTGQTAKAAAFDALSPMTTAGDIIYGGAAGTGTRLAAGTDGHVLTLASGSPTWAAATGGGGSFSVVVSDSSGSNSPRNLSTIGSGGYGAMTNNSVSLTTGTWELSGWFQLQAGTGTGAAMYANTGFYAANGTDSGTIPAALSTIGTVTGPATFVQLAGSTIIAEPTGGGDTAMLKTYIAVTSTQTVYAVPRTDFSVAGTSNVSAYVMARKLV